MTFGQALPLIEAMCIWALSVRRQLESIAPFLTRPVNSGGEQLGTDSPASMVRMDVHRLDLGAPASPRLQMPEDDQLAGADHLAIDLGHQDVATGCGADLLEGGRIGGSIVPILLALHQRAQLEQFDEPGQVSMACAPDGHRSHRSSMPATSGLDPS